MQGVKYKRRWVELTTDTLVYASSQQELLTGKIQVFAMKDMLWVKADAEAKFLVKFKERTFKFKVESGSSTDRSAWVAALQRCKQQQTEERSESHDADKLEHLRKIAEQQLLDHASPSSSSSGGALTSSSLAPTTAEQRFSASDGSYGGVSVAATLQHAPIAVHHRMTETGARPLSPRSLLSSAKAGSAFVSSIHTPESWSRPAESQSSVVAGSATDNDLGGLHGNCAERQEGQGSSAGLGQGRRSSEKGEVLPPRPALPYAPISGLFLAHGSTNQARAREVVSSNGTQGQGVCGDTDSQPFMGPAAVLPAHGSGGNDSRATSAQARDKRAVLTRRLTPGVMLINTSTPTTPALSASLASDLAASGRCHPLRDLLHAGSDGVMQLENVQPETSSESARSPGSLSPTAVSTSKHTAVTAEYGQDVHTIAGDGFDSGGGVCDEILRLDLVDSCEAPSSDRHCSAQESRSTPQCLDSSSVRSPSMSGSRRPESAPHCTVRHQHTPLKSCLRHGATAAGSISTPNSNEAVAAAAAAAVAMTLVGSCSPAPFKVVAASGHDCMGRQSGSSYPEWTQADWYEPAEDADNPTMVCHNAVHSPYEVSQQKGGLLTACHVGVVRGSNADIGGGAVGVQGAALGVKADDSWLEDDFDS